MHRGCRNKLFKTLFLVIIKLEVHPLKNKIKIFYSNCIILKNILFCFETEKLDNKC